MTMAVSPDEELIKLLKDSSTERIIRNSALKYLLGLTAERKGIDHILQHKDYLHILCCVASEDGEIVRNACKCLINISSYETGAYALITMDKICFFQWIMDGLNSDAPFIQLKGHILSNVSRYAGVCDKLADWLVSNMHSFKKLINFFCCQDSGMMEKYSSLACLFSNITQTTNGQRLLMSKDNLFIKNLLSFTTFMDCETRRIGVVRAIRNCCFNTDYHMWLLKDVEILPALLLPLAGPEEFNDDENEQLPIELQYLDENKQREPNPNIRKLLIESITKLCATKPGRMFIKDSGAYYIIRELHKWENGESALKECEDLVSILIGDEPEPGMENLMEVKIPEEVQKMFEAEDCPKEEEDPEKLIP